ncbi:MAG: hypothetical protein JO347_08040, partial [Candidatus Eremiobacteraeota bacterium]|nr:hypothetical protein [Candidatus Eremiobacteraeota bacterium]
MSEILNMPFVVLVVSLALLWLSVQVGALAARKLRPMTEDERQDLDLVISSSLTMLA